MSKLSQMCQLFKHLEMNHFEMQHFELHHFEMQHFELQHFEMRRPRRIFTQMNSKLSIVDEFCLTFLLKNLESSKRHFCH